jgi:hypothetical protein
MAPALSISEQTIASGQNSLMIRRRAGVEVSAMGARKSFPGSESMSIIVVLSGNLSICI